MDTDSDYNMNVPKTGFSGEGPNTIVLDGSSGIMVDAADGDFYLTAGSPAIDAGTDLSASRFTTDFDGTARPQDGDRDGTTSWDIGAYEYISVGPEN